ncbi:MAG: stage II sporulation protein R [Firmicutes bacterium]|nr:stage II sporulation protein R [Bacillota bacterium]
MKARIVTVFILCLIGGLLLNLTGSPPWATGETVVAFSPENLIRLHVLANSDQPADQEIKLLVRDRILEETAALLAEAEDRTTALAILAKHQRKLVQAAEEELVKHGFFYPATVTIGTFGFPARQYEFGVLPSGEYQALRVVLGKGQGRNWWCVLFPPVCHLVMAEEKPAETGETIRLRWKALEELQANKDELLKKAWVEWAKWFQLATTAVQ